MTDDSPVTDTDPAPATPDQQKDHTIRGLHAALSRIRNIDRTPPLLDADDAYTRGWQAHHAAVETELLAMPGSEQRTGPLAGLYARWVKAGPPPLGQSVSRWWDRRLVELGGALGEERAAAWTPPPPGDRREQLPDAMLALIRDRMPDYLSTACQTADTLACAACYPGSGVPRPQYDEIREHAERLHERCRINQKFTGQLCACGCH